MDIFQSMDAFQLLIMALIVGLAVIAVAAAIWLFFRWQRTSRLRSKFGLEYDYTAQRLGGRRRAESVLADREKEAKSFQTHPLTREEVDRFAEKWQRLQARFVDEPTESITNAELLVNEVVEQRGYPAADFEQRVAYLSVDHPQAAHNYRAAREVIQDNGNQEVTTEKLRQAMNYYRELFNDLLATKVQERYQWQRTTSRPN
jgi:hypothetical protein